VYRNISPFSGSPQNITLLGESAGSMNVLNQLHSLLPGRFRRAILQSGIIGTPSICVPSPLSDQNLWYTSVKSFVGASNLAALRELPISAFDKAGRGTTPIGTVMSRLTIDDVHCNANWRDQNSSADPKTFSLLIGDCRDESTVWSAGISIVRKLFPATTTPLPTPMFLSNLFSVFLEAVVSRILNAYDIHSSTSGSELSEKLLHIMNDLHFAEPTQSYSHSSAAKGVTVYRYLLDELNPFAGPSFKKKANHSLDLPFLYGNLALFNNVEHPEWEKNIEARIKETWIRFAYGEKVWKPVAEGGYYAFGPNGKTGEIGAEECKARRGMERWDTFKGLGTEDVREFAMAVAKHVASLG
jgi:carboxylesterase type B